MKSRTIYLGRGQFISDLCAFLPANCFINKRIPACGGTTLELLCKRNSIIIVPNVPVIIGKVKKMKKDHNREVLGIYHPFNKKAIIMDYLLRDDISYKKIMVTPESYKYLKEAFEDIKVKEKFNHHDDFFLLFDESEKTVQDVSYRKTIVEPLNDFFLYKERSMMSATPIIPSDPRFEEHGFEHVIFEPNYNYAKPIHINFTNNVIHGVREYLKNNDNSHYCFFMNSTDGILSLIESLGIEDESYVFCGDTSVKKLKKLGFKNVSSELRPFKKYTFLTSRFYSAVDIDLDFKPDVILITDTYFAEQSVFDPATESIQCLGRFRNQYNKATHITNTKITFEFQTREMALKYLEGSYEAYERIYTLRESSPINSGNWEAYNLALKVLPFKNYVVEGTFQKDYFKIDNKLDEDMVKSYYSHAQYLLNVYQSLPNFVVTPSYSKCTSGDKERWKIFSAIRTKDEKKIFKAVVEQLERFNTPPSEFRIDNRVEVIAELAKSHPHLVKAYNDNKKPLIEKHKYSIKSLNQHNKKQLNLSKFKELPVIADFMCGFNADVDIPSNTFNAKVDGLKTQHNLTGHNMDIISMYFTPSKRFQKGRQWYIRLTNPKFIVSE